MLAENRPNILVVEDDPGVATLVRRRLERAGYGVYHVERADEGLAALSRNSIDLVLLDYRLPEDIQGLDFCARMKQAGSDVPVILVTGFSNESLAIQALRAGIRDFITKSTEYLDYLPEAVARVLKQVDTERQLINSETRLASIIDSAKDAIIIAEDDHRISLFNPAAEMMFRCPATDAHGQPVSRFIPRKTPQNWHNNGNAPDEQETLSGWIRYGNRGVRSDGSPFPVEISMSKGRAGSRKFYTIIVRDVTERVRAEQALRQEQDKLTRIVSTAPGVVCSFRVSPGTITFSYASPAIRTIFGVEPKALERDASIIFPLIHPDDVEPTQASMRASRDAMQAWRHEFRVNHPERGETWVEAHAVPTPDGDGVLWFGFLTDVTARKKAELALQRNETLLTQAGHMAHLGAWDIEQCDPAHPGSGVLSWSDEVYRIFGYEPGTVAVTNDFFFAHVHPDDREAVTRAMRHALENHVPYHIEHRLLRADLQERIVAEHAQIIFDTQGRPAQIIGAVQDITDRRRAEENLRLRDRALHSVSQGILICDADASDQPILYANPGFERITGYSAQEVLGRNCRFLQGPKTDRLTIDRMRESIREQRDCSVEIVNYRKDGTAFVNALHIAPVTNDAGQLTHFVGVLTDVTERRRLEEQFQQSQKMEAVGQLAGGVAHDFNNLLTIISGYSEMLLSRMGPSDPTRASVMAIAEAGERAAALTRQLLAFSRRSVLEPKVLNLNDVVRETEKMLRRLIGEDILLTTVLDSRLLRVKVDPGQLSQVLMNLAVNARDAMPKGGKLTIVTENLVLDPGPVQSRRDVSYGKFVLLSMSDTGQGIPSEIRARIFEPFFTTKGTSGGTGLGLAVVHGIVKQSGGYIELLSEIGQGTTFNIYLPAVEEASIAPHFVVPTDNLRGRETILLVEDEEAVRGLATLAFQSHGYHVLVAQEGMEALRIVDAHRGKIDLLVTDVVMPGLGGGDLAKLLKKRLPDLKILYSSGYTDDSVLRHGILQSEVAFLQKPYTPFGLLRKAREMLDCQDSVG